MMENNGADLMANELENYSYKDPVSPKCSPDGPLTQPWSPGSPSSSSLQGQIHEESEETVSTIEQVHISSTVFPHIQGASYVFGRFLKVGVASK